MGFLGFAYLPDFKWFVINAVVSPLTCIVVGCFLFLLGFLMHKSLIIFVRICISIIACNKGTFIQIFLNSDSKSNSGGATGFSRANLSRYGGGLKI